MCGEVCYRNRGGIKGIDRFEAGSGTAFATDYLVCGCDDGRAVGAEQSRTPGHLMIPITRALILAGRAGVFVRRVTDARHRRHRERHQGEDDQDSDDCNHHVSLIASVTLSTFPYAIKTITASFTVCYVVLHVPEGIIRPPRGRIDSPLSLNPRCTVRAAVLPLCGAALLLSVVGCGPMTTPMPARL